jgi:hypothetical protein
MSLCLGSVRGAGRADRLEWSEPGPLRWPYLDFSLEDVLFLGQPAVCRATDGVYWEYDGRRFLVTDLVAGAWRKPAGDPEDTPPGPWRHMPACTCEACRLGEA